jgi:hypothetical protein
MRGNGGAETKLSIWRASLVDAMPPFPSLADTGRWSNEIGVSLGLSNLI